MIGSQSADRMGVLVRETFRAMVDQVEHRFDDTDLVLSQWLTLKLINTGKISYIGDIVRELGIQSGSATRLADQLENRGLITRRRSEQDRRVVMIGMTESGKAIVDAMQPRLVGFWAQNLSIFSTSEQEILFDLLSRLRDRLIED